MPTYTDENGNNVATIGWETALGSSIWWLRYFSAPVSGVVDLITPDFGLFGGPGFCGGHLFNSDNECIDGSGISIEEALKIDPAYNSSGVISKSDAAFRAHDQAYYQADLANQEDSTINESFLQLQADLALLQALYNVFTDSNYKMDKQEIAYDLLAAKAFEAKILAFDLAMAGVEEIKDTAQSLLTSIIGTSKTYTVDHLTNPTNSTTGNPITGDLAPKDIDPDTPGVQIGNDAWGNIITDPSQPSPGRVDELYDTTADDRIEAGGGTDKVKCPNGGANWILGGAGDDLLDGDSSSSCIIEGEEGSDIIFGGVNGGSQLFAESYGDMATLIAAGETALDNGLKGDVVAVYHGDNYLYGSDGYDIMWGGIGKDLIVAGGGNDLIFGEGGNITVYWSSSYDWSFHINVSTDEYGNTTYTPVITGTSLYYDMNAPSGDDDVIYAGAGNDYVEAEMGDDEVYGGLGSDTIFGGAGYDFIEGGDDGDFLFGGNDGDYIDGGAGNDRIEGHGGNDDLFGGAGADTIFGGTGDDYLDGEAENDLLAGAEGADIIFGGEGNDSLHGDAGNVALIDQGADYIDGEGGDNLMVGYGGNDTLFAENGNDTIYGGDGSDYIDAGEGANVVLGGADNDEIWAGTGNDWLQGDVGNDYLDGGAGNNTLLGGEGDDELFGGSGVDILQGDAGNDYLEGFESKDTLIGLDGNDILFGDEGDDHVQGDAGDDYLDGGIGNDYMMGMDGLDTISGGDGIDSIWGGAGNDTIYGGAGNDQITGEAGDDYIDGGLGDDWLQGDAGNDTLVGAGSDTFFFATGYGSDVIENYNADYQTRTSHVQFGTGITSANLQLVVEGNDLKFQVMGTTDSLTVKNWFSGKEYKPNYLMFSDSSYITSWYIDSVMMGSTLYGTSGNDYLIGRYGYDTIIGGTGNDTLAGGAGDDTYVYNSGDGSDTIDDTVSGTEGNTLSFGTGITSGDLTLTVGSLDILIGNTGGVIHINNFDPNDVYGPHAIDLFKFADGTTLTYSQLLARGFKITGTTGDDQLSGTNINDTITGLSGNDLIVSGAGNDTLDGGTGIDTLEGGDGADTLMGRAGNDALYGGNGNDSYVFNIGDGIDTITDSSTVAEGNKITFGQGITAQSLAFAINGNILTINIGANGDAINLVNFDRSEVDGSLVVRTLQFADGSQVNLTDILNIAPVVVNPLLDQMAVEDSAFSFTVPAGTFSDPDTGDTLTYSATLANGSALPSWLTFNTPTMTFSGIPANENVGTLSIKVKATDAAGASVSSDFDLTINNVNDAPVVSNPITDKTTTIDTLFTFIVPANTFSDMDAGDTLTYSATLTDGTALPDWLTFDAATMTFSGTPSSDNVGTLSLKVTATDAAGAGVHDDFELNVTDQPVNHAPVVANPITDQTTLEDEIFSFTVPANTFADVDVGDTLTYSATLADGTALPSWLAFDAATMTFSGSPVEVGSISIKLTATDHYAENVSDTFDLNIQPGAAQETIYGTNKSDNIVAGSDNNIIYALNGDDTVYAGAGKDTIYGEEGKDVLYGESGDDVIYGDNGEDYLNGGSGNDRIDGGNGKDFLYGGLGNDSLDGGNGNDTYLFGNADGQDVINETASSSGDQDRLKLTEATTTEPVIVKQGNDLYVFTDANNYVKIASEFQATNYGIERLEVSDGHYITRDDIQTIVDTMSAINDSGMDVLQKYNAMMESEQYQNILAASWQQ